MESLIDVADALQSFCKVRGWKYCFIDGLAVQKWGEPRLTRDVDLSLLSGFGGEEPYVRELLKHYQPLPFREQFARTVSRGDSGGFS